MAFPRFNEACLKYSKVAWSIDCVLPCHCIAWMDRDTHLDTKDYLEHFIEIPGITHYRSEQQMPRIAHTVPVTPEIFTVEPVKVT